MISMKKFHSLSDLINYHINRHRGFELDDAYKLLHQSVFGPEHLGEGVSEHTIAKEMDDAGIEPEERLLEPISMDITACRINLRAVKRLGVSPALVARAVKKSAAQFSRDRGELSRLWYEVGASLDELTGGFGREDFEELTQRLREKHYPPLHHSPSYRECNRPAYRVVLRGALELLMPDSRASDLWR